MHDRWRRRLAELPNQFVLNQNERPPFQDWRSLPVGAYTLHTHPKTTVHKLQGRDGEVLVIGVIVLAPGGVVSAQSSPPGQYVAITPSQVFSDAGSLMQAFFDRSTNTVASSLRLFEPEGRRSVSPELLHGSRPDWYWGPRTSMSGIDFLLPSQLLDLRAFTPAFRRLPQAGVEVAGAPAEILQRQLSHSFKRFASTGDQICLAMTGGIDSRTLFAAALAAGVEFETYTMTSRHVHPLDVTVAREISDRFGVRHRILDMGRIDPAELNWYLWYAAGQSVTLDADFHAAGLWNRFDRSAIHVRGLGFELGRDKYRDFVGADDARLIFTEPDRIWKKFTRPWVRPLHRHNHAAFQAYAAWLAETLDSSTMDFRDRLYLEQGIGSWCASAEYGLGATGTRRVSIGNSTAIYDLLMGQESGPKKSGPLQREMMRTIDPGLLDYPFAKPSRRERLRFRARDTLRAVRLRQRLRRLR